MSVTISAHYSARTKESGRGAALPLYHRPVPRLLKVKPVPLSVQRSGREASFRVSISCGTYTRSVCRRPAAKSFISRIFREDSEKTAPCIVSCHFGRGNRLKALFFPALSVKRVR